MTTKLVVLIAAHGQPRPLRRTLQSLADCHKPAGYAGVVVVENGPLAGLEAVVRAFPANLQFQYLYSPPPNKSIALNHALRQLTGALVVFTDDDVQVPCETLAAYSRALGACRGGAFYGGPIAAEYEGERPPAWLLPLLPRSAAGWQLATPEKLVIEKPEFIGPNFAAFADDLLRVGGFDARLGPGGHMISPGEDTEIQERLLAAGVRGYYVSDAGMRHCVRTGGATVEFAVQRAQRNGIYWGISRARRRGFFPREWLKAYGQWLNDRWRIARLRRTGDEAALARARCLAARWQGRWRGVELGWTWDRQDALAPNGSSGGSNPMTKRAA